jgi:predicted CoA-substrate-specific enzyme activase
MILLGIDLGSVSVTAAVLAVDGVRRNGDAPPDPGQISADRISAQTSVLRDLIRKGSPFVPDPLEITLPDGRSGVAGIIEYRRTRGRPFETARDMLERVVEALGERPLDGVRVTGSGAKLLHASLGLPEENEFRALAAATAAIAPATRTLVEIGGESSKILFFEPDGPSGWLGIADYATNGDCAAGTGSFLDQQAGRLQYAIEDVGEIAAGSERAAKVAGRCSVFAKSDMIHAQQKGYLPPEVLRGLCETVARNFRSGVAKGRIPQQPVLFVGGVAANRMVAKALREVFELPGDLVVPSHHAAHAALGCALREAMEPTHHPVGSAELAALRAGVATIPRAAALSMDKVILLRDQARPFEFPLDGSTVNVALGIDIGSVSTNLVLLDREGRIVREVYTRTQARPVEVVTAALHELYAELGDRVRVVSVGTTGSGRELIGELVGADTINDEITAHKTGADFVARTILNGTVETIFEIGGQDAKYIHIEDGIVVDFAMNEACAAGTGSFLEERAEELGVCIKGEFAERALRSTAPVRLGERCTVFMERDVNAWQQRGAVTDDLLAGLAISVATNYINRVVRGRKITGTIFFQGGTAYNDAVAAAFAQILGREIVVPPYNGVIGAIGSALLAWERETAIHAGTRFRGWDLGAVDYRIREFTCRACENHCDIQEFTVEGEKTFWGDQCGDRYRRRARTEFHPVIDDLVRQRREWLLDGYQPGPGRRATAVMPRALYHHERFPYWNAFFRELGIGLLLTPETTRATAHAGIEASVAEPCFPIQVAHGHMAEALSMEADFVFLPNYVNAEATHETIQSFYCPWGMALPFVVKAATGFESKSERILHPLVRFRGGREAVATTMHAALKKYGVRRGEVERALVAGEAAMDRFRARIREAGREAMAKLDATGEPAVLLVGRPYNLFDPVVNIDIPRKLRDIYGVNVLPLEFLAADDTDIEAINANMFWSYGRKILAGAREAGRHERLHLIYLTNFKCGPDSYIKQFVRDAFGSPFLTLQFDGHANDAGMLTRVEAFLDSQGILRRWAHQPRPATSVDDETSLPAVPPLGGVPPLGAMPPLGVAPVPVGCACPSGCAGDLLCAQPRTAKATDLEAR